MAGVSPGPARTRPRAENDIYTALLCVAFLFLLVAAIYIVFRAVTLFGTVLPPGGT